MNYHAYFVTFVSLLAYKAMGQAPINTTFGFVTQPLTQSNFDIQKPYDVPVNQRYNFSNGVHKLWVFKTDKPHSRTSKTLPRTEIRFQVTIYFSLFIFIFI